MHRTLRALLAMVLPIIVLIAFVTSAAANGNNQKVDVCHWASHKFVEIRVSVNALPAHLGHGDVLPDEYGDCPGDDGDDDDDDDGDDDDDDDGDDDRDKKDKKHDDDDDGDDD